MARAERLIGTGAELGIWRETDGTLVLSVLVASGHAERAYDFPTTPEILDALLAEPGRHAVLDQQVHQLLQNRLTRLGRDVTNAEVLALVEEIALMPAHELEDYIALHRIRLPVRVES